MSELAGKRIVITGSSRGLGRATAEAFARHGARLVLNGTQAEALAEAEERVRAEGGEVVSVQGSVAESATCEALIKTCVQHYGGIDILIHNAGQVRDRTLFKMSDEDFDTVIATHLRGAWACGKYAALACGTLAGGQIIQVISNSGLSGGFGQSNYAAAKAGMLGLQRTWVLALARYGIRCNAFWPIAATEMTQVVFDIAAKQAANEGKPAPAPAELGFGQPHEVAEGLLFLASDAASHWNGQVLTFNGRRTALWSAPAETHITYRDQAMTREELAAHYAGISPETHYQPVFVP